MTRKAEQATRVEFGDWQTPLPLARQVVQLLAEKGVTPRTVVEPTCGEGTFLQAAAEQWPQARLLGFELNPDYVERAREKVAAAQDASIAYQDFFSANWDLVVRDAANPVLFLGNPPWVTSSTLGGFGGDNLPQKTNFKALKGLDAITGKGNFDVSEWMMLRLLGATMGAQSVIAMLCKTAVARRLLEACASERWCVTGEMWMIDAKRYFDASVDAVLLVMHTSARERGSINLAWSVYPSIEATSPSGKVGVVEGVLASDLDGYRETQRFAGPNGPAWRSGLKHDCSRVMEFSYTDDGLRNGFGDTVHLEPELVFPLLKGSDVANGRLAAQRGVLVPQRFLGQSTSLLAHQYPKAFSYLMSHEQALSARKSSIYKHQPPFSVFGVGDYTFAPWKVAICGLYKRLTFQLVGPQAGKPVVFDDTCYFLPFNDEASARAMFAVYTSPEAQRYFQSRIFWDSKRPISKSILQSLDPYTLAPECADATKADRNAQLSLGLGE